MTDSSTCVICFTNPPKEIQTTETIRYTCTHGPSMCTECRQTCAAWNPSCPLCRETVVVSRRLLRDKYNALCEEYSYVPKEREMHFFERLEMMAQQHSNIFVQCTYIPVPLHVVELSYTDICNITLSFYKDYQCVLIHNKGKYYYNGKETTSLFNFWAHSIIDIYTTPPF